MHVEQRRQCCKKKAFAAQNTFECIINGDTTGDKVRDFAIVACNGHYDEDEIARYQKINNDALRFAGQYVLFVGFSALVLESTITLLPNIFLGTLGDSGITFDVDKASLVIPLQNGVSAHYREVVVEDGHIGYAVYVKNHNEIVVQHLPNRYTMKPVFNGLFGEIAFDPRAFGQILCGTRNVEEWFGATSEYEWVYRDLRQALFKYTASNVTSIKRRRKP